MTNTLMTVVEGATTTTFCVRYDGHESPVRLGALCATGTPSGLPQAQRTRGRRDRRRERRCPTAGLPGSCGGAVAVTVLVTRVS